MKKILAMMVGLMLMLGSCLAFVGCEKEYNPFNIAYIDVKYNGESLPKAVIGVDEVIYYRYDGKSPELTPTFMYKDKPRQERIYLSILKKEWDSYQGREDLDVYSADGTKTPTEKGCYVWKYFQRDEYPDISQQVRDIIVWIYEPEDVYLQVYRSVGDKTIVEEGEKVTYNYGDRHNLPLPRVFAYGIGGMAAEVNTTYYENGVVSDTYTRARGNHKVVYKMTKVNGEVLAKPIERVVEYSIV